MTKKDYVLIASVLNELLDEGDNDMLDGIAGIEKVARNLCYVFANKNPLFNRSKFLSACGITE